MFLPRGGARPSLSLGVFPNRNLDLLRSMAVALVVLSHVPDYYDGLGWGFNYKVMGRTGVALFFVHTTLVLMLSMQRNGASPGPFLVRRVFRIYPLSITAVACMSTLLWLGHYPLTSTEVASNVLLVQNLTGHRSWPDPLWSLPYELQMYLVLPALYAFVRGPQALARVLAVYAAALAVAALLWANTLYILLIGFVPCFLPGAIAFVLMQRRKPVVGAWLLPAVVLAGAASIPAMAGPRLHETSLFWVLCLVVGLIIPLCRELTWRPLAIACKCIATYSYAIYLTHVFVMGAAFMNSAPWSLRIAMFLALQALLARLAYRWIERPGIELGIRLSQRLARTRAVPQSA